jgi:hypothetical protein
MLWQGYSVGLIGGIRAEIAHQINRGRPNGG